MIFHTCTFCPKERTEKITKNSPDCQNLTVFRDKSILGRRRKVDLGHLNQKKVL